MNIGRLSSIVLKAGKYQLQYAFDQSIPRLTNADIYALGDDLQMDKFEFLTNHWAVKDVDLFQVLHRREVKCRPRPSVFQLSTNPINSNLVSLMMPFSAEFTAVNLALKSALEAENFVCKRADDFWFHPCLMQDIVELICTSKVVICDLSNKNANVLYEAGIAHTLGKEVILITQNIDDVPFDLRAFRWIRYLDNQEGRSKLAAEVVARLKTIA